MEKVLSDNIQMIYPMPATIVSCGDLETGFNTISISWCGNISSNPPRIYIAVNPARYSCDIIRKTKAFVINLGTISNLEQFDYCGFTSGRDLNKAKNIGLTYCDTIVNAPQIEEFPVSIACEVEKELDFGSEIVFVGRICGSYVSEIRHESSIFHNEKKELICTDEGYHLIGERVAEYGFSIKNSNKVSLL